MSDLRRRDPAAPSGAPRLRTLQFVDSLRVGGAERQFLNLVAGLRALDVSVHVACFRAQGDFAGELAAQGVRLIELPISSLPSPVTAARACSLARLLRRERIDVVHTTTLYPNLLGVTAARLAGTPAIVASVRDMGTMWNRRLLALQRFVCRFADAVVTNAEAIANRLESQGWDRSRIEVIGNGVTPNGLPAGSHPGFRRELGLPADAPLVGVVGRLHWIKGLEDFVAAAARVAARFPAAHFLVVGPIHSFPEYERRATELRRIGDELGLGPRLVLTGLRRDVPQLLTELSVSVSSSLAEGLSNTLLESMAAGVPVVATAVGGTPEVVADGVTGILVPPRDPAALADGICRLLAAPELASRMGRAGRQRVEDRFGPALMVERTRQLYLRLLACAERRRSPLARRFASRGALS
jgi:glycosyltransferase involved in cell wall biosynthesis